MLLNQILALSVALALPVTAFADEPVRLAIKGHRFVPAQITAPAGTRFRLAVTNQDATPSEFESHDLRAEKVIVGGGTITVMAGPLQPGTYRFKDDYHPATAGTLVVTGP